MGWHSQMESSISLFTLGILKWNPFFCLAFSKGIQPSYTQIFFCLAFSNEILFFVWHSQKESNPRTRKYSFAWHSQMRSFFLFGILKRNPTLVHANILLLGILR